jgi:hypothetical protein
MPGGIAGSPCLRGSQIRRPGPPGWGLGVALTAPHSKNPVVRKSKEGYGPHRAAMPMMVMMEHSNKELKWISFNSFVMVPIFMFLLVKQSKAVPLHGRLGERKYSSYSLTTWALDGCEWSASRPCRALAPGKGPPVPIVQEAGWAPELVWTQRLEEKSFAPAGDRTSITRSSSP